MMIYRVKNIMATCALCGRERPVWSMDVKNGKTFCNNTDDTKRPVCNRTCLQVINDMNSFPQFVS